MNSTGDEKTLSGVTFVCERPLEFDANHIICLTQSLVTDTAAPLREEKLRSCQHTAVAYD